MKLDLHSMSRLCCLFGFVISDDQDIQRSAGKIEEQGSLFLSCNLPVDWAASVLLVPYVLEMALGSYSVGGCW